MYYYRKVREYGRVRSEYVGAGPWADLMVAADRLIRHQRQQDVATRRAAQDALRADWRAAEHVAAAQAQQAEALARLLLVAVGQYQHKRTWRRRRSPPMPPANPLAVNLQVAAQAELARRRAAAPPPPPLPPRPAAGDTSPAARIALVERCNRADADPEDVAALRALLREHPDALLLDAPLYRALRAEVETIKNALTRELRQARVDQDRAALGYATAPALERPLIDHLLLCELRMAEAEHYHLAVSLLGGATATHVALAEQRLDRAQGRLLRAVETLARVRRVRVALARVTSPDGTQAESVSVERPAP